MEGREYPGIAGETMLKRWKFRIRRDESPNIEHIPDSLIIINFYITQLIILIAALVLIGFGQKINPFQMLADFPWDRSVWLWGGGFALAALALNGLIVRFGPQIDDGGVNKKLFRRRPLLHIVVICGVVAFCEEMLFRGAVQPWLGNVWTSFIFTVIHVRYLRHWLPAVTVFLVSFGLGYIYEQTGTLWTPIFAHFLIDFVLGCVLKWKGDLHGRPAA